MKSSPIIEAMLQAVSQTQGHGGQLTEEAVRDMFAKAWDDDIMLEVLANDCPPPVRAIMMRRVKELMRAKRIRNIKIALPIIALAFIGLFVYLRFFAL